MNPQYKKGVLELCVLSLLRKGDRYGYEISEYLSQRIDIADGTVYPLLRKLKADGLVSLVGGYQYNQQLGREIQTKEHSIGSHVLQDSHSRLQHERPCRKVH